MKNLKYLIGIVALATLFGCESSGEVANPGSKKAADYGSADAQSTGTVIQRTEPGGDK
jgi:hypothetical protein